MKNLRTFAILFAMITTFAWHASSLAAGGTWKIVPSPNLGHAGQGNALLGIAFLSPTNVWATGFFPLNGVGPQQALAEHWNGSRWSVVPTLVPPGASYSSLNAIAAASMNDIWAVGYAGFPPHTPERRTLIEHWNGSAWSIVSSPNPGNHQNELWGISVVASNDVWAVGDALSGPMGHLGSGLTLHWDGARWSAVANPTKGATLFGVTALSAKNVWAVGTQTAHWDGIRWNRVRFELPPKQVGVSLQSVTAASSTDIWAAGYYLFPDPEVTYPVTLIERFDGSSFKIVHSPDGSNFFGIKAFAPNDIWAVGFSSTTAALTEHWDGTAWSIDSNPRPGSLSGFAAVDGRSASDMWAVGVFNPGSGSGLTLTEHHTIP